MEIDGIISALVVGVVIGALGRFFAPGRQKISILLTIVVGVVAALLGSLIARAIGVQTTDDIDWIELIIQIGLAVVGVTLAARSRGGRRRL